jgi:hypothetical protein
MYFCVGIGDIFPAQAFTTNVPLAILISLYLPEIRPSRAPQVNPDVSLRLEQYSAPQLNVCKGAARIRTDVA